MTYVDPDLLKAGRDEAVAAAGGVCALARELKVSHPTIIKWKRVPAGRVLDVERITGVPRWRQRPDIYPAPEAAA